METLKRRFVIEKTSDNQFQSVIYADNGEELTRSETIKTRAKVRKNMNAVLKVITTLSDYELKLFVK